MMRYKRSPRTEYVDTQRKRSAVVRWQQKQRDALPLLGALIAETQAPVDAVMSERVAQAERTTESMRAYRAECWRRARRMLDGMGDNQRAAILAYWNGHRWLPGDPGYLLDLLRSIETGRMVADDHYGFRYASSPTYAQHAAAIERFRDMTRRAPVLALTA